MDTALITIAGIGLLTLFCQWTAWRLKFPAILLLLLTGILIGPVLGWLKPQAFFGHLYYPIISLSVAIILFEGSLTLSLGQIRGRVQVVRNLVSVGISITALLTAILSHRLLNLHWGLAILLGTITAVSGPTVIAPMLRTIRPTQKVANILRWEGILIDPIGAIMAVLAFALVTAFHGYNSFGYIVYQFVEMVLVGVVLGVVFGYWLGVALRQHWFPDFLHNVATLIIVLIVFTLANRVDDGAGLLAVTIMGIWLANMDGVPVADILGFKESLSILLISGLFIMLASGISFAQFDKIIWPTLILIAALQFIVRPINIFFCTVGSELNWRERVMLSWIAPRGIVAAAVAAIFALRLQTAGIQNANLLVLLTFLIIIGTVIFQSITARPVARLLKVAEPEPKGLLIIGANVLAREIAKVLKQHDFRVLITALNWDSISQARMEGIEGYFGNPVSEHADRHLNLIGIGKMFSITPQADLNALACMRYKQEFGSNAIFTIQTESNVGADIADKYGVSKKHRGNILFDEKLTYSDLLKMIQDGATIRSTQLTENFDFKSYQIRHHYKAIPLFAIGPRGNLHVFGKKFTGEPGAGWTVISLLKE